MGRNNPRRMIEKPQKQKQSGGILKKIIILIIIVAIAIVAYKYITSNSNPIASILGSSSEDNITLVIYYSENDGPEKILQDGENVFSSNIEITYTENCSMEVKKDGKTVQFKDNITLTEEGTYEITLKTKRR